MTQESQPTPPVDLPSDPHAFWRAGDEMRVLETSHVAPDAPSALERLGASPFPKNKFPFLGFLATVYDHVATHARARMTGKAP
jgi:hypothetical protein